MYVHNSGLKPHYFILSFRQAELHTFIRKKQTLDEMFGLQPRLDQFSLYAKKNIRMPSYTVVDTSALR